MGWKDDEEERMGRKGRDRWELPVGFSSVMSRGRAPDLNLNLHFKKMNV
jgi:hypothetical protein